MERTLVEAIRPSRPDFIINGLVIDNGQTIVTGGSMLQRECFVADMAFSVAFGKSFHGRGLGINSDQYKLLYVGTPKKISGMLWAWNQSRNQIQKPSKLECAQASSIEELKDWMPEILAGCEHCNGVIFFIESAYFEESHLPRYKDILDLIDDIRALGYSVSAILCVDSSVPGARAIIAQASSHIHLCPGDEDAVIVEIVRSELNDYPLRFSLAKAVIDCVLVYQDSHILDDALRIIFEVRKVGKKRKIRVIDVLTAIHCSPGWPTESILGNILDIAPREVSRVLEKMQNLQYLDLETLCLTEKGIEAIRNHNPSILVQF